MDRCRTKLVCTIGPASADRIGDLVAAGMDVARINFSHGTPDEHKAYVHAVRAAAHAARRSVAVMADLPGPKIRLGELEGGALTLETGATFTLRPDRRGAASPETAAPGGADDSAPPSPDEGDAAPVDTAPADQADTTATADPTDATAELSETRDLPAAPQEADDTVGSAMAVSEPTAAQEVVGDSAGASVSTANLAAQLEVGDRILLADGAVELSVTWISGPDVVTEVVHGGQVRTRSGVNIPSARLTSDGLTDEDRAAVPRALELRVDLIAQSFVRSADDVRSLRRLLPADGPRVVAKIETHAAVDAIDEIAQIADGIMVARGDLGVDIPFEDVPLVQKDLINRAHSADRFTIVATQMLESMTAAPRPSRAEASDVANAVLDGADALMLSAETAIGAYPVEALQTMARICQATEKNPDADFVSDENKVNESAKAIVLAAAAMSGMVDVGAIWCFTRTGRTAELLSFTHPRVPIVAFTLSPIVARRLAVRRGVIPMVLPTGAKGEPLVERMENAWRAQRNRVGLDAVVLVTTSQNPKGINRVEIHKLSERAASA